MESSKKNKPGGLEGNDPAAHIIVTADYRSPEWKRHKVKFLPLYQQKRAYANVLPPLSRALLHALAE